MQPFKSPTNMAWILGRTQTNGPEDYPAVHAIQAGYKLIPLSQFGKPYTAPEGVVDPGADMKTPPVAQLQENGRLAFLRRWRTLEIQPASCRGCPRVANLATIGVIPGQVFDPSNSIRRLRRDWRISFRPRSRRCKKGETDGAGRQRLAYSAR